MQLTCFCLCAMILNGIAEVFPLSAFEKLTLDGVLFLIIWYLLTQGKGILDRFAVALEENTKAIRRVVKRLERVEKIVKTDSNTEPWTEEEGESSPSLALQSVRESKSLDFEGNHGFA